MTGSESMLALVTLKKTQRDFLTVVSTEYRGHLPCRNAAGREGIHPSLDTNFGDFCTHRGMLCVACTHVLHACDSSLIGPGKTVYLDGDDTFYGGQSERREITARGQEQEVSGGGLREETKSAILGCVVP